MGFTSPAYYYPDPKQERDDDKKPPLFRRPWSRGNSGDRPQASRAVERDEPTRPAAAHSRSTGSPPSTKRVQLNQPMHSIPLLSNTMQPEVTAVGYVTVIIVKPPPVTLDPTMFCSENPIQTRISF